MRTYTRDEIVNKHNQPIYYWSKAKGKTELEKFRNSGFIKGNEYIIPDKNGMNMTCIVDLEEGPEGYQLVCFNDQEETIFQEICAYGVDRESVEETLYEYDMIIL